MKAKKNVFLSVVGLLLLLAISFPVSSAIVRQNWGMAGIQLALAAVVIACALVFEGIRMDNKKPGG